MYVCMYLVMNFNKKKYFLILPQGFQIDFYIDRYNIYYYFLF